MATAHKRAPDLVQASNRAVFKKINSRALFNALHYKDCQNITDGVVAAAVVVPSSLAVGEREGGGACMQHRDAAAAQRCNRAGSTLKLYESVRSAVYMWIDNLYNMQHKIKAAVNFLTEVQPLLVSVRAWQRACHAVR